MTRIIAAALAAGLVAGPALAADPEGWSACELAGEFTAEDFFARLEGSWTASNRAGFAVIQGGGERMTMPMPPQPPDAVDIVLDGTSGLRAMNWGSNDVQEIELTLLEGPSDIDALAAEVKSVTGASVLTEEEVAVTEGCEPSDLPRLHATGLMTGDDAQVSWTATFLVVSDGLMYGAMKFEVTGAAPGRIDGIRLVNMTR